MAPVPSRRALLGAAAALPLAALPAVAMAEPDPDAELIRLCKAFRVLTCRDIAMMAQAHTIEQEKAQEPERDALHDQQTALVDKIREFRCKSLEGIRAKALALVEWSVDWGREYGGAGDSLDRQFIASILDDLTEDARASLPLTNPDGALLALAEEWQDANASVPSGSRRDSGVDDDEFNEILDRRNALAQRITNMRAVTLAGMTAKARIVDDMSIEAGYDRNRRDLAARSLARDLIVVS